MFNQIQTDQVKMGKQIRRVCIANLICTLYSINCTDKQKSLEQPIDYMQHLVSNKGLDVSNEIKTEVIMKILT